MGLTLNDVNVRMDPEGSPSSMPTSMPSNMPSDSRQKKAKFRLVDSFVHNVLTEKYQFLVDTLTLKLIEKENIKVCQVDDFLSL